MSLPTESVEAYPRGVLAADQVRKLVDEHNQAVQDDHAVCALLDGDATVGDTNYEAQLTALEIDYEGYTPTESAVGSALGPFQDPGQKLGEELFLNVLEQVMARVNDQATIAAKLDGDAGVPSTVYGRSAGQVPHLVRNIVDQDTVSALAKTASGDILAGTTPAGGAGDPEVRISRDGGRTWRLLHAFSGHTEVAFVFEGHREVLFAGLSDASQAVLYVSHDYGRSWEEVDTAAFDGYATFAPGGALVTSDGVYYVGGGETDAPVFKSSDGGETWTQLTTLSPNAETEVRVLLEAEDGSIIAGAGGGAEATIHRSTDEGQTWSLVHTQADHDALTDGIVTGAGTLLLVGSAEGTVDNVVIRSTDDGATWATNATGPTNAIQASIVLGESGRIYVGGDAGNQLHFSDDDGATWAAVAFDFFTNDTQIERAIVTDLQQIILATTNATDGAGLYLVPDFEPRVIEALGSADAGDFGLFPGAGGGIHGDLLEELVRIHNHLSVVWHSTTALLDNDGLTETTYEAQLAAEVLARRARTGHVRTDEVPLGA